MNTPTTSKENDLDYLRWYHLGGLTDTKGFIELTAATNCDGIQVMARWTRKEDGTFFVEAISSEEIKWEEITDWYEGECVPRTPPINADVKDQDDFRLNDALAKLREAEALSRVPKTHNSMSTKKTAKGRGGKRPGAGRKAKHGVAVVTSSISMIPEAWSMLDAQRGAVSQGEWIFGLILKADLG